MKTKMLVVCVVGLILTFAPSLFAAAPATRPTDKRANPMTQELTEVAGNDAPVRALLGLICENANLNLALVMQQVPDVRATLTMRNVSVRTALDAVLANSGWDYEVQDDNLYVFDRSATPNFLIRMEAYNVGDLVDYSEPAEMSSLIDTIKTTVDPNSWRDNGGVAGTIRAVKGALVINQIPKNHHAIGELLSMLREHKNDPSPSPRAQALQMESKVQIVGNLKETCSDPQAMGIIAISELRGLGSAKPSEMIDFLQARLSQTKSLPMRNAIRLTLKDLYLETGDTANFRRQLEAILAENDKEKPATY